MSRRAKAQRVALAPDDEPADDHGHSPNGHGALTPVVIVEDDIVVGRGSDDDDIIVWRAHADDAWMRSPATGGATSPAAEPVDAPADQWLRIGGASRFVNVHFILGALARRRSWLVGFAVAGAVIGLLLSLASSPSPRAETTVLLAHPSTGDAAPAMATDAQLLETNAVARRVVESLDLRESPASFAAASHGTALSDDLLGISVSASSESDAVRRANAMAREYLAYRSMVYSRQSDAIIEGLQQRQTAVQAQISELNQRLGAQASSTTSDDPETAALLARRASLNQELITLGSSIAQQANSSAAVSEGSSAIDPAAPVGSSTIAALARDALSGLVAGLVIGLAVLVLLAVTSNRVWRRDDVASAMRHSVDLSTGPIRVGRWTSTLKTTSLIAEPTPELAKVVAAMRDALATSPSSERSIAVIALGGLEVAAVSVCAAATALARDGEPVTVVDASERGLVRGLLDDRDSDARSDDGCPEVRVVSLADARGGDGPDEDEIVLVLAELDPAQGADEIRPLASTTVAIVSAGRSTMATLRTASDMLAVARLELRSVILVGASASDESFGRGDAHTCFPVPTGPSDTSMASPSDA